MCEHPCIYPSKLLPCIPLRWLDISNYSINSPCKLRDMFSSGKRFGLVLEDKREVEAHNTVGKERASFIVINPAFLDLSTDIGI